MSSTRASSVCALRLNQRQLRARDVRLLLILISHRARAGVDIRLYLLGERLLRCEALAPHADLLLLLDEREKIGRHREHDSLAGACRDRDPLAWLSSFAWRRVAVLAKPLNNVTPELKPEARRAR